MIDAPQLPDPDGAELWSRYLHSCRRLSVEPTPRERAIELIAEWTATMQAAQATKH